MKIKVALEGKSFVFEAKDIILMYSADSSIIDVKKRDPETAHLTALLTVHKAEFKYVDWNYQDEPKCPQ